MLVMLRLFTQPTDLISQVPDGEPIRCADGGGIQDQDYPWYGYAIVSLADWPPAAGGFWVSGVPSTLLTNKSTFSTPSSFRAISPNPLRDAATAPISAS